jgi:hypothetical protein
MTRILSAFEAVRPRGTATAPAAVTKPHNRGKAPSPLPGSLAQAPVDVMVMDRTGKRIVPLQPCPSGLNDIENSTAYRVSQEKRRAMAQTSI